MALNRPQLWWQVAWSADPNDPAAVRAWTDLTHMVPKVRQVGRGRQYELAKSLAGQPPIVFNDPNEWLNPANTSSPYHPNVLPYREICGQCMWPNGGTGNLINPTMWMPNDVAPLDPSFEAYANGAAAPSTITAVGGTAPTITTSNPQQGTKSLTYTVVGGATVQGVEWQIPTVPGQQYTTSVYVRQTSGSTQRLAIVDPAGTITSATTITTGAYVRLVCTYTATQPALTARMATTGTAVAGTVNVDAVQHEPGGSATAFTTSGPNIFPLLRDFVERWPRSNQEDTAGFAGRCDTTAVDGFAALNAITLDPDYIAAVKGLQPTYYWRLDGGLGTSAAQETSGNQGPPLVPYDSKYGAGTPPEFGSPIEIKGAYGGSGVKFTPTDNSLPAVGDTILSTGRTPTAPPIQFPVYASTWSASIAAWVKCTSTIPGETMIIAAPVALTTPIPTVPVYLSVVGGEARASLQTPGGFTIVTFSGVTVDDGLPHLLVGTVTQVNGGNTTLEIFVDGVLRDTQAVTTASIGGQFSLPCTVMNVGGAGINGGLVVNGVVASVALWARKLSAGEVTMLWTAGGLGYAGELSGTRLARRLAQGRYTGATRISPGSTTMQPSTSPTIDALSDAQNITAAEDGTLWVAPDGALVMEGRQQRWLRLTPRGVFGEDEAGGEIPYLDGVVFDFDPTFVYSNVRVSRVNGTVAVGGSQTAIDAAARRYFPRSAPSDSNDYATDALAQYKADWVFNSHRAPLQRVSVITVDPASNPSLWTRVLGIEVGQRWTVKRRAKAANNGAGIVQSEDYFVERVVHNEINMETGAWTISLLMSPIGLITNSPGVTLQPWILEHATYGVLDSTTVLGW